MKKLLLALSFVLGTFLASTTQAANCGSGIKACAAGDTVVSSYTLTSNLTCNGGTCLYLKNKATLSCGGSYSLIGTNKTGVGVEIPAGERGYIKNCKGDGSSSRGIRNFKVGVYCNGCQWSRLWNSIVQDNGPANTAQGYNVQVTNAYHFNMQRTIIKNAGDEGVHVSGGDHNIFSRNVFTGNDVEGLYFFSTNHNWVIANLFTSEVTPLYIKNSYSNQFRTNTTDTGLFQFIGASTNNVIIKGHYAGLKFTKTTDGTPSGTRGSNVHLFRVGGNNPCVQQDNSGTTTLTSPIWDASCVPHSTCTGTCSLVIN